MAFELSDIKTSQEIFYYLLEHHEIKEADEPNLYKAYLENEDVQALVKSQGETAVCTIERYGDTIYLIPEMENKFLGFSRVQLKKELCRSNATEKDYYLTQFTILVLLLQFYDGQGSTSRTRNFIRVGELQNKISEYLNEGVERYTIEDQDLYGVAFTDMREAYEALRSSDAGRKQRTTKEGFLHVILKFLQKQGLIEYVEQDEMISTTPKLDHFMDWNLLNQNNYDRVRAIVEDVKNE